MPEYNAIDNINAQNAVRLGIRQRLQTKRNGSVVDVVDWNSIPTGASIRTPTKMITRMFSRTLHSTRDWLSLNSRVRYDLDNNLWRTLDHSFTITPNATNGALTVAITITCNNPTPQRTTAPARCTAGST